MPASHARRERERKARACDGKHRYSSMRSAEDALERLAARGQRNLNVYECPFWERWPHWHVGRSYRWARGLR